MSPSVPALSRPRWSNALLGLGVGLATATQLRGAGGLGPGELLLALWAAVAALHVVRLGAVRISAGATLILAFWAVALLALATGWLVGLGIGVSLAQSMREFPAFLLSAIVFCLAVLLPSVDERFRHASRVMLVSTVVPLLILLGLGLTGRQQLGPIEIWYYGLRFQGWATNPNQIALAVLPVPFLAAYLFPPPHRPWRRGGYALLVLGAIAIGVASQSDALFVAWTLGLLLFAGLRWLELVRRRALGFWASAALRVALPLIVLCASVAFGPPVWQAAQSEVRERLSTGAQGAGRIARWQHGLEAAATSPVIGLGPGPFSGPRSVFGREEAHNTFIDWTASTGLLGFAALSGLLLISFARTISPRPEAALTALLAALAVYMSFHYVMRQPMFWFLALFPLVREPQISNIANGQTGDDSAAR